MYVQQLVEADFIPIYYTMFKRGKRFLGIGKSFIQRIKLSSLGIIDLTGVQYLEGTSLVYGKNGLCGREFSSCGTDDVQNDSFRAFFRSALLHCHSSRCNKFILQVSVLFQPPEQWPFAKMSSFFRFFYFQLGLALFILFPILYFSVADVTALSST